jgi:hypothetical protein
MNTRNRAAILMAITFALMVPYLGFAIYYSQRFPSNQMPDWFTNTLIIWFTTNFLILMLFAKFIFKKQVADVQIDSGALAKSRTISARLVILWSGFFVYGVVETVRGKYPLSRAIPAGAFLLVFIGIFGWSLFRSRQTK